MKTSTKWLIFISILAINYKIGDIFTSGKIQNSALWLKLVIIGGILTFLSFILILIPTNKKEWERDFLKNYRGGGIGSIRGGMFN